jgi:hypothetical protein
MNTLKLLTTVKIFFEQGNELTYFKQDKKFLTSLVIMNFTMLPERTR